MGHIAAFRQRGIPASPPMFIPGLGAFVRLKAHPPTPAQDARVGLAGPVWGTGAALATERLLQLTGRGLASLVHVGAVLNLFNLIPVWQLDGARGIQPLSRNQRLLLLAAVIVAFSLFREGILILVGLVLGYHCFFSKAQGEGNPAVLLEFVMLILTLGLLSTVRMPAG